MQNLKGLQNMVDILCGSVAHVPATRKKYTHASSIKAEINSVEETSKFIMKANKVHNNKYDYSKTKFLKNYLNVIITCKEHGDFNQRADYHLKGGNCAKCIRIQKSLKSNQDYIKSFVTRAKEIHENKYTYEFLEKEFTSSSKVTITCPIHGNFTQKANNHLSNSHGCLECGNIAKLRKSNKGI